MWEAAYFEAPFFVRLPPIAFFLKKENKKKKKKRRNAGKKKNLCSVTARSGNQDVQKSLKREELSEA